MSVQMIETAVTEYTKVQQEIINYWHGMIEGAANTGFSQTEMVITPKRVGLFMKFVEDQKLKLAAPLEQYSDTTVTFVVSGWEF